jgi:hypothetical protein
MQTVTVLELWAGGTGAAGAGAVYLVHTNPFARAVWRWFSGHAMDGHYYTDAGWLRAGVRSTHPQGRPVARWHYRPRLHRAAIRSGSTGAALAAGYGLLAAPTLTADSMMGAGSLAFSVALWRAVQGVRNWHHHRVFVGPLHAALAPRLGIPAITRPHEWMEVPRGFAKSKDGTRLAFALPKDFSETGEARKVIAQVVSEKLALEGDLKVKFEMLGNAPRAIITVSVPPPARLAGDQLMGLIEAAKDTAPVIGIGRDRQVVTADLEADSPHVLLSAGSGGGKSELTGLLIAQGLHRGGVALILDAKKTSHQWAKGLPNVRYCRTIQEIHNALMSLGGENGEIERRSNLVDNLSDINGDLPPDVNIGPRFFLVFEEANTTMLRLQAYWRSIKEKGDPNQSPAIDAFNEFIFMGRSMKMHAIAMGQQMNATATGGGAARESFALRALARYQHQTWRILVGNVPMPKSSRHKGRWQIVTDYPRETQAGYLTNEEKREYAQSGIVTPFPDLAAGFTGWTQPVAAITGEVVRDDLEGGPVSLTGPSLRVVRDEAAAVELVGLRQAVNNEVVSISLAAIRRARADDPEFPKPRGERGQEMLYDARELRRWEANRERNRDEGTEAS